MRLIDADEALRLFGKEYEKTKELIHNGETQLDSLAEGFTEAHHIMEITPDDFCSYGEPKEV